MVIVLKHKGNVTNAIVYMYYFVCGIYLMYLFNSALSTFLLMDISVSRSKL